MAIRIAYLLTQSAYLIFNQKTPAFGPPCIRPHLNVTFTYYYVERSKYHTWIETCFDLNTSCIKEVFIMNNKTLILSIALNGYQYIYRDELKSHSKYAIKNGYMHQAVTRPFISPLGVECCWLKLTLMRSALLAGYESVLFLDADAEVQENCPPLSSIIKNNKFIYMSKGYSGRFNSGVVYVLNNEKTHKWLNQVINSLGKPIKDENSVGWGENGHVIEFSKGITYIEELDNKWNNTSEQHLKDYIRHKNAGPMRTGSIPIFLHKIIFYISSKITNRLNQTNHNKNINKIRVILNKETSKILNIYPTLSKP